MAEQDNKLARHLGQIKQIDPEVTLLNYYKYIKPFLFGILDSTDPLDPTNLPKEGVWGYTSNGVLAPFSQIYAKVVGKPAKYYTVANATNTDFIKNAPNIENIGTLYFFPSDLVRLLTGLARIFYVGDEKGSYNRTALQAYQTSSSNDLYWINKWGDPNEKQSLKDLKQITLEKTGKELDFFYEDIFEAEHKADIQKLLEAVKDAALEFEAARKTLDTTNFEPQSEVEAAITKLVVTETIETYKKAIPDILRTVTGFEEKIKPALESNKQLIDETIESKKEAIANKLKDKISANTLDFFRELFSEENKTAFESQGRELFDRKTNSYLLTLRITDQKKGVLESEEYQRFSKQAVKRLLEENQDELTKTYILPLFVEEIKEPAPPAATPAQEGGAEIEQERILENPVTETELIQILQNDATQRVVAEFIETFVPKVKAEFVELKEKLPSNYQEPIAEFIKTRVTEIITSEFVVLEEEKEELVNEGLFVEGKYETNILTSDWYKELLKQSVQYIIDSGAPDNRYPSLFTFLFETLIAPQLELVIEKTEEPTKPEEPPTDSSDTTPPPSGAVVPPAIPTPLTTPEFNITTDDITRLTPEETRQLQYEAAWLYNRAVYELTTSKGSELTAEELRALQVNIYEFTAQMQLEESGEFTKLFGSSTARQKALLEFYQKNGHLEAIQELYSGLSKRKTGKDQIDSLLQKSLNDSLGIDSPIFTENVKNTLDAFVIQYGLNQDFFAFDPETKTVTQYSGNNPHDVLWFIENIPIDRLAIILNIPEGALKNDPSIIAALKAALKKYAKNRASELSLHIQNTSLQNGLVKISDADAQKIKNGDEQTIAKHLSFTGDLRNLSQKHGSDTVAAALDDKPDTRKEKILKQYKTFIPLWNQLTGNEQKLIYERYGIPLPRDFDPEIQKLEFIPEFILFDPSQLKTVSGIAASSKLDEQQKLELLTILEEKNKLQDDVEISELIAQYRHEQELAAVLNNEYTNNSDPSEIQDISAYTGEDYDDLSYFEKFQADQEIQDGESTEYEVAGAGGLASRFSNSRLGKLLNSKLGKKFKKKLSPTDKTKKAANRAIGKSLSAVASKAVALIPGVGTALSAALLAMKNKAVREFVSGAIVGGLAFLIGKTIYALGSIGGLIGGVLGGVAGFIVGGPAGAAAGVVAGANIGQAILPQRWDSVAAVNRGSTVATTVPPKVPPGSENLLDNATGIGIVAVGGFSLMSVFITLFIVLTIQSAFLIPVPKSNLSVGFDPTTPVGGIGLEDCEAAGELSSKLERNGLFALAGRAFDIVETLRPGFWCYWNWNPQYDGLDATFNSRISESPDLFDEVEFAAHPYHCVYISNFPAGCSGDWNKMGGNALYWCTWLVNHTYQANYSLAARIMADQFKTSSGHLFMPVDSVTYHDIHPGDVIFTSTAGRNGNIGHVAIVHDVGPDFIRSVDSNASSRYNEYTVGTDGKVQVDSVPWLGVVGFGRKL